MERRPQKSIAESGSSRAGATFDGGPFFVIDPREYLRDKAISFRESNGELITKCLFSDCDADSKGKEAHLYISAETGQYECKKCGAKGNLVTLAKHFGDKIRNTARKSSKKNSRKKSAKFDAEMVEACHLALPIDIRQYLNARGITDAVIDEKRLGWGKFYGKWWITIPVPDIDGDFIFFKLRQDPSTGDDKMTFPSGIEAQIYGWETLQTSSEKIVICEGELDRLALLSKGIPAVTSTHGAMTFKEEWCEVIGKNRKIYICFDNDDAGREGAGRVAKIVESEDNETYIITLPQEVGEKGDITDYFVKLNGSPDDLFEKYAKEYPERIDASQFKPITTEALLDILGLTIKRDAENKLITFLCLLSAYTEDSQLNVSFNAPSSSGKSYIPTEIARLFPEEDVKELGYCSPTSFFHATGKFDKDKNGYIVDMERKIYIFLDQPHQQLLAHLRPLLSHDKKEVRLEITDKSQKSGLRTKVIFLRGFPAVVFCTATLQVDEQESTRFILLSPETHQEKIREAIHEKVRKETNRAAYQQWLDENPERSLLKKRILAIKQEGITDIRITNPEKVERLFLESAKHLRPRHSRDIGRVVDIIKLHALLNLWFRNREGATLDCNDGDIEEAFKVWDAISESQELDLPPFVYQVFKEILLPAWAEKVEKAKRLGRAPLGLDKREIAQRHFQVYGRPLPDWMMRQQILPMLDNAGLISQEKDPDDKRKILVYPTEPLTISDDQNNSESDGGVKPSPTTVEPDLGGTDYLREEELTEAVMAQEGCFDAPPIVEPEPAIPTPYSHMHGDDYIPEELKRPLDECVKTPCKWCGRKQT